MPMLASSLARTVATAAILSGLAFASPSLAANSSSPSSSKASATPASANSSSDWGSSTEAAWNGKSGKGGSPEDMAAKVETRIQTLHDKLKITPDQESEWNDVAQAMRDNEAGISQEIQARHANASSMSAVDDLQSYQKIAQAHADGMNKVISAFSSLYDDMSDSQKKNADEVFGRFEGHRGMSKASAKGKKGSSGSMGGSSSDSSSD